MKLSFFRSYLFVAAFITFSGVKAEENAPVDLEEEEDEGARIPHLRALHRMGGKHRHSQFRDYDDNAYGREFDNNYAYFENRGDVIGYQEPIMYGRAGINQAHIWIPKFDEQMRSWANEGQRHALGFIPGLGLYHELLVGQKAKLGRFDPRSKLYILFHGHTIFSHKIQSESGHEYTAAQVVTKLRKAGLPKTQRDIHLLVCYGGGTLTRETQEALVAARDAWLHAKENKLNTAVALEKTYKKMAHAAVHVELNSDNADDILNKSPLTTENAAESLLPFAAQLAHFLKEAGFTNFRVIGYRYPVIGGILTPGEIAIDPGRGQPLRAATAADEVIWQ